MSKVLEFEYENNKYEIDLANNEYIFYKNGNKLTEEDNIEVCLTVLKQLIISRNDYADCGDYFYNHKTFRIFCDTKNKLKFFFEKKDGDLISPSNEDLEYLNIKFNNQLDYVTDSGVNTGKNYQIKVKIGKTIVTVLLTAGIALNTLPIMANAMDLQSYSSSISSTETIQVVNQSDQVNEQKTNQLIDAINNNPYLSSKEKALFTSSKDIIAENINYINYDMILQRLKTFKVSYGVDKSKFSNASALASAAYIVSGYMQNNIVVFYADSFEKTDKDLLIHEFCHSLQDFTDYTTTGVSLLEVYNVMFDYEYYDGTRTLSNSTYNNILNDAYALAELLGPDIIRQYHFDSDINILINALMKIIPDQDKAYQLVSAFDNKFTCFDTSRGSAGFDEDYNNRLVYSQTIYDLLGEYYQVKYNMSMESDALMMAYLYSPYINVPTNYYDNPDYTTYTLNIDDMPGILSEDFKNNHDLKVSVRYYKLVYEQKMSLDEALEKGYTRGGAGAYSVSNGLIYNNIFYYKAHMEKNDLITQTITDDDRYKTLSELKVLH